MTDGNQQLRTLRACEDHTLRQMSSLIVSLHARKLFRRIPARRLVRGPRNNWWNYVGDPDIKSFGVRFCSPNAACIVIMILLLTFVLS